MKKLVSEDGTMNYNKWVKGIADRELSSQKLMVNDIFKAKGAKNADSENSQDPNAKRQQTALPYPLSNLVPALGDSIVSLQNAMSLVSTLQNNPILKNKNNIVHIEQCTKALKSALELIKTAAKSVDNLESFS